MKSYLAVSVALLALLSINGCMFGEGKYATAVEEVDAVRAEMERAQAQRAALEQQVKTLKELNAKLSQEAQLAKDELQRIEHGRDTERASLDERTKGLEKQIRTLAAQHRVIRKQYARLKQRNKALQSTVARYQKELKERRPGESPATLPTPPKPKAAVPKPVSIPKTSKPSSSVDKRVATGGTKARTSRVNLNTASLNDMVLLLGLSKADANRVISNRPYRIRGELIAKNVLQKPTFEQIYDRITVRQP